MEVEIPKWAKPLLGTARYKGAHGGRGSGKSHWFATMLVLAHVQDSNRSTVCVREVQKSLAKSVKRLIEQKIRDLGVSDYFDVTSTEIRSRKGSGLILFQGMSDQTADSIKSLEGFDCAWVEEAQSLSQRSLDLLRPTIRRPGSEIWFTWNPQHATDPVDKFLRSADRNPDCVVVEVNYLENPWLSDTLRAEAEYDQRTNSEKYGHVWLGLYIKFSESRVYKNWRVSSFAAPPGAVLRFGVDWGFYPDPTTCVRAYIDGKRIYVEYEAYKQKLEIDETADFFRAEVPESDIWDIWCASDRPERVSGLRRAGFKAFAVPREKNSIKEGVEFLQGFEWIVHPRCVHTIEELSRYSRKIDPLTGAITPEIEDKWNHCLDAIRYMVDRIRRVAKARPEASMTPLPVESRWGGPRG